MGLTGGATAELQRDHRWHVARAVLDRGVVQQQLFALCTAGLQLALQLISRQCGFKNRALMPNLTLLGLNQPDFGPYFGQTASWPTCSTRRLNGPDFGPYSGLMSSQVL